MKISCSLTKDLAQNNGKFTNAIEKFFGQYKGVEKITSTVSDESIVLDLKFSSLEDVASTKFIYEEIKKILGDRLVNIEIDF